MEKLIATVYDVRKDGKDAYEVRMDDFGVYVSKDALDRIFKPLLEAAKNFTAFADVRLPIEATPVKLIKIESTTPRKGKRKYTKRNLKYWNKQ